MKISILYISISGNTEKAAEFIREGILDLDIGDIAVKLMNLAIEDTLDTDFVNESTAVIIGTPTYSGSMAWQLKKWFDTSGVNLSGKLGAAFATAKYIQGGPGIALDSVLQHMLVKGMLVYSSGTGCGLPYIHYGPIAFKNELDKSKDLFFTFGIRIAEKAVQLFS
jgi:NAD(P)H dehydrogenase (quinone)